MRAWGRPGLISNQERPGKEVRKGWEGIFRGNHLGQGRRLRNAARDVLDDPNNRWLLAVAWALIAFCVLLGAAVGLRLGGNL